MEKEDIRTFEYDNAKVNIHGHIPTQDDWIKCCYIIMKGVYEQKEKAVAGTTTLEKLIR